MKKTLATISSVALFAVLSLGAAAQDSVKDKTKETGSKVASTTKKAAEKTADTTKQAAEKTADTTKKAAEKTKQTVVGKSDEDVQKCITEKLAASDKLKTQGFSSTVSSGEATLTGTATNAGSKGAATKIAKGCGAKKVTNSITVPPPAPAAKKLDEKKAAPPKN